jgi:hypothetical protein
MPRDEWQDDKRRHFAKAVEICQIVGEKLKRDVAREDEPWTDYRSYKVRRHDLALAILHEQPRLTMAEAEKLAAVRMRRK